MIDTRRQFAARVEVPTELIWTNIALNIIQTDVFSKKISIEKTTLKDTY